MLIFGCVWFGNKVEWDVMVRFHWNVSVPFQCLVEAIRWNRMVPCQRLVEGAERRNGKTLTYVYYIVGIIAPDISSISVCTCQKFGQNTSHALKIGKQNLSIEHCRSYIVSIKHHRCRYARRFWSAADVY